MNLPIRLAALFALCLPSSTSLAQRADPIPAIAGPLLGPTTTEHSVLINGSTIRYRASFREYALADSAGKPQATISATSYVRESAGSGVQRPVFFLFNGGPGASSSPLHFSGIGPRLKPPANAPADAPFANNPDSLLDVADLIFIDPVGTGFSRVLPGGDGSAYWAPRGDASAVMTLVRNWLKDNGRSNSPVFIGGESYGGFRLATMVQDAAGLNLRGLLMISPATDMSGVAGAGPSDEHYVLSLPTMAAAAWYHKRVDRRGLTAEQFYDSAKLYADNDYLVALQRGSALPQSERERVARRLAGFIGLSRAQILAADLRVSPDLFVEKLLPDKLVGRLDSRVAAPVQPPARSDRPAAANDPSLGLGKTNVILSPAIARYMAEELGVRAGRDYASLTLDVNFRWNWQEPAKDRVRLYNPLRNVADAMAKDPSLKLMVAGGLYDLAVPVAAPRYAVTHAAIPLERVRFLAFPAGHSLFDDPVARPRFARALRAFVSEGSR